MVADNPDAPNGFLLLFSGEPFSPVSVTARLGAAGDEWQRPTVRRVRQEGWLCPALLKYFDGPPKNIYVQAKPKPDLPT
jgi:hypothetical protein